MKKTLIAAFVGGFILFLWQFISWAAADFHQPVQSYTDKQDAIMEFLKTQQLEEGGYIMPSLPKSATTEEWKQMMKENEGKPWASIQYHTTLRNNMGMNMARGFIINVLTVFLFCWIISQFKSASFKTILLASILTGLIIFFNVPYVNFIWYENFDIWAHLADGVVSWGLCGLWLGWWLNRNKSNLSDLKVKEQPANVILD